MCSKFKIFKTSENLKIFKTSKNFKIFKIQNLYQAARVTPAVACLLRHRHAPFGHLSRLDVRLSAWLAREGAGEAQRRHHHLLKPARPLYLSFPLFFTATGHLQSLAKFVVVEPSPPYSLCNHLRLLLVHRLSPVAAALATGIAWVRCSHHCHPPALLQATSKWLARFGEALSLSCFALALS
jgi:hypothetical protein